MSVGLQKQARIPLVSLNPVSSEGSHSKLKWLVAVVAVTLAISIGAIYFYINKPGNNTTNGAAGANASQASASTSDKLPADFPYDHLGLYMGAVVNSSRVTSGKNTAWTVVIETRDSLADVKQQVMDSLANGSWKLVADTQYNGSTMLVASKDDPIMRVVANIGTKGDKTRVGYTLTKGGQQK